MAGRIKRDRIILYIVIIAVYIFLWIHTDLAKYPDAFSRSLINNSWQAIYATALNLAYFELILPLTLSRRLPRPLTVLVFVLCLFLYLVVFSVGLYGWQNLGTVIGVYEPFTKAHSAVGKIILTLSFSVTAFVVFAVFKLFFDYMQFRYEGQQLRLEKNQAELSFLKAQINPHFLFNTLNNIYSLSKYQPKLVSESVLRLSKILRYMLYETGSDFITADKEIKVLTDYIDLEKLRYNENVSIDFKHEIEDASDMLPPLLLLPLVENAFKHGVAESRGKRFIEVLLAVQDQKLYFVVRNSSDSGSDNEGIKENIGLSNLRRRLNLLYKEFDLTTEQKDSVFTATLNINLSSHV